MKFTITVDELDIANVKLGQVAYVNADAIPGKTFEAKVTSIASEGTSSGDGVTVFTVELTIDEPGELKSGMNVNANILINEAYNVVGIPEDALMSVRGNYATVLVKSDGKKKTEQKTEKKQETSTDENQFDMSEMPEGIERPDMGERTDSPQNGDSGKQKESSDDKTKSENGNPQIPDLIQNARVNIPNGCELRQVEIGVSNGNFIEIVSGLSEGETVVYIPSTSTGGGFGFGGMMGGGMPGGMMGGGMPGGMRSGGQNRAGGMMR